MDGRGTEFGMCLFADFLYDWIDLGVEILVMSMWMGIVCAYFLFSLHTFGWDGTTR